MGVERCASRAAPSDRNTQLIMKTSRRLLLAGLLAGSATLLTAGPGAQYWARASATKPAPAAVAPAASIVAHPAACVAAVCPACACSKKA